MLTPNPNKYWSHNGDKHSQFYIASSQKQMLQIYTLLDKLHRFQTPNPNNIGLITVRYVANIVLLAHRSTMFQINIQLR